MADVRPFRGIRYDPDVVKLDGALAPPYDVINDELREDLYSRGLRNIVRIDCGMVYEDDVPGERDRYTRAAQHLQAWRELGILVRDDRPAFYVSDHEFTDPDGGVWHRRGLYGTVAALPWDRAPLRPHERTLRGPKEDRLRLLEATKTHTSAVFAMWTHDAGLSDVFDRVCADAPLTGGRADGELAGEKHLLWRVDDDAVVAQITAALAPASLYVADGHHRYETAAAHAETNGGGDCLIYLCAADDPSLQVLPTHRLVHPQGALPTSAADLVARGVGAWEVTSAEDLGAAARAAASRRDSHHAFAVQLVGEAAVISTPREPADPRSPREGLDTVVLEERLLRPLGLTPETIREGALSYSRDVASVRQAVSDGSAALGVVVNPSTTAEVIAVADSGETMPQKSTYFYPKVPTGLVLAPEQTSEQDSGR